MPSKTNLTPKALLALAAMEGSLHVCGPHQVWPLRSECCGRGVPTKVVCTESMKMCCKNSLVKGIITKEFNDYLIIAVA